MNRPLSPALPAPSVLVVDDQPDCADTLAQVLQGLGYRTRVAYDGDAAVAAAQAQRPDAVILDLHMPVMGGVLACNRIRQQQDGARITIVALTASCEPMDRAAAELAGFDHFLIKPVMLGALVSVLPRVA